MSFRKLLMTVSLLAAAGLYSCDFIRSHGKINTYYIPGEAGTKTWDTSLAANGVQYTVKIASHYGDKFAPAKMYKDPSGQLFFRYHREVNFDVSIAENGTEKFTKKNLNKNDFGKDLPNTFLDSAVMSPISFQYVPASRIFVFGSTLSIPETTNKHGAGLVVNKDFKPEYVVAK